LFVFYLVFVGLGQNSKKRFWVQTQWHAGETSASPLPMSLTWGCRQLLELCESSQKNKGKKIISWLISSIYMGNLCPNREEEKNLKIKNEKEESNCLIHFPFPTCWVCEFL
jgi:hypothetical protein